MTIPIKSQLETIEWLGVGALHESDNLRLCTEQPDTWEPIGEVVASTVQAIKERNES